MTEQTQPIAVLDNKIVIHRGINGELKNIHTTQAIEVVLLNEVEMPGLEENTVGIKVDRLTVLDPNREHTEEVIAEITKNTIPDADFEEVTQN